MLSYIHIEDALVFELYNKDMSVGLLTDSYIINIICDPRRFVRTMYK